MVQDTPRLTDSGTPSKSQNPGTDSEKSPMAEHKKKRAQICSKLPCTPMHQTTEPKDTRMAQTTGSTTTTMERPEYGFRSGATGKRWIQWHMGGSRLIV
jgi:hypothetical protein